MGITVIVTGTKVEELTLGMMAALRAQTHIVLHTGRCGCGEWLTENGIPFETLDDLYDEYEDFDAHADACAKKLLAHESVCYCVLNERDLSLKKLIAAKPNLMLIGPVTARALAPVVTLSAAEITSARLSPAMSAYVTEIDSRVWASDVKLRLMDVYGDEAKAYIVKPDGAGAYMPLENLDRLKEYDHRCACLVNPTGAHADFGMLLDKAADKLYENNDNDTDSLAKALANVVRCICAGEAFGEFTAGEVTDKAMEELDK